MAGSWRWPEDGRSALRPANVELPPGPLLSIIVPVHGVADYLPECIDSILAGAPPRLQVVAVDDASPDGAGVILDDYARRDARVCVLHLAENVGLGPDRNAGAAQARGEYLCFV